MAKGIFSRWFVGRKEFDELNARLEQLLNEQPTHPTHPPGPTTEYNGLVREAKCTKCGGDELKYTQTVKAESKELYEWECRHCKTHYFTPA